MSITEPFFRARRKMRQIAACDLTLSGKIRYCVDFAIGFFRPPSHAVHRKYRLTGGTAIVLRENSTDRKVFDEIFLENTYTELAGPVATSNDASAGPGDPVILIDLGANIGLSAIALARQLHPTGIVAVEPDPENFALLQQNLHLAGLTDRSKAIRAFAGAERGYAELVDSGNGAWGMRMGTPARTGVPVWRIDDIVSMAEHLFADGNNDSYAAASPAKVVLKCDIEGAEAQLFQCLPRWEHLVQRVILELHTEFLSVEDFCAYLDASSYAWQIEGELAPDALLAVIALERGELKVVPQSQHAAVS